MDATAMDALVEDRPATRANPSDLTATVAGLLRGIDADALSGRERADWMRSLTEADAMLTTARSRLVSAGSGGPTVRTAELVDRTGMSCVEARRAVRLADALVAVPAAADALADGRITTGHASVLTHDVSWLNRPAAALDDSLVEAACEQSVDEFRATVAEWERVANDDLDGAGLAVRQHRNRTLSWTTRADGGPTSLDNLVLLYSAHHHLVHERQVHERQVHERRGTDHPAGFSPRRE